MGARRREGSSGGRRGENVRRTSVDGSADVSGRRIDRFSVRDRSDIQTHREESLVNLGAFARAPGAVQELRLELRGGEGGAVVAPGGGLEEREGVAQMVGLVQRVGVLEGEVRAERGLGRRHARHRVGVTRELEERHHLAPGGVGVAGARLQDRLRDLQRLLVRLIVDGGLEPREELGELAVGTSVGRAGAPRALEHDRRMSDSRARALLSV